MVAVAGTAKSRKGVFDIGSKSFLIGQGGCHLNLPKASIPAKAVRIRAAAGGFDFEGVDGFSVPIGSMSIVSGRIEPGGSVKFQLDPYEIQLEVSATPGRAISDLEAVAPSISPVASPAQASQPAQPVPAPHPRGAGAPPTPAWSAGLTPPPPAGGPGLPAQDLRVQLQELAIDVRPDQRAFGDQAAEVQEALDADMTITDLGAQGFQAMRFGNPLAGLDLSLVRADGPAQGQVFKITQSPLVVGRSGGDMIIKDRRVSSKHAQLDVAGPRVYTLKDLASTNGTTVNDRPISVGHLQDGDVVSFGGVTFDFHAKKTQ